MYGACSRNHMGLAQFSNVLSIPVLKLPLYLHDFQSDIQFLRVEISPSCIAL